MTDADITLLLLHADGACDAAECRAVNELLRHDAEAREMVATLAMQATVFADMAMERSMRPSSRDRLSILHAASKPKLVSFSAWRTLAIAAGIAVLGSIAWFWKNEATSLPAGPAVVQIGQITGSLHWREDAQEVEISKSGTALPAGTFSLLDDLDGCELLFADGTQITLRGPAELEISDDGQKCLRLRSGTLVADVMPQPAGRPMIVRTFTSESIVLGTRFELTAAAERTSLAVNHGLVQLRRLSDNQTIQVPEQRIAEVSRDISRSLSSAAMPVLRKHWRSDLSRLPQENWRGDWMEGAGNLPGRMQAVGKMSKHYQAVHYRVQVTALRGPLVALSPATSIRLRFRLRAQVPMELFVSAATQGGHFAGNFRAFPRLDQTQPDPEGWRELTLPLSAFERIDLPKAAAQPEALRFLYVSSIGKDAGLELADIEVTTP